ncbi:MAG: inorganic phosphate transporter family protein [Nanoarchaeota archaeon]|nr:inorganic phosphate transporter family protein [Nanoarchaeota archaeon]
MDIITILIIVCGIFVGWTIGTNDAANCMGTAVGAGLTSYRKAVWIVAFMALLGAVISGRAVAKTMGKGIVDASAIPLISILAVLIAAGLYVTIMTFLSLPVSTSQAVMGGIAGMGLILGVNVKWFTLSKIFLLGFVTPILALVFSYILYKLYARIVVLKPFLFIERFLGWAVLLSGAFLAYSMGANNLGNSMGLVTGSNILGMFSACVIGGIAMGFGSVTLGIRVMKTISTRITELSAHGAFAAQAGSAIAIYILSVFGVPTSTSFGIVGGVAGVGLVKGIGALQKDTLKRILSGWIMTPIATAVLAIIVFKIIEVFV